MISILIPCYNAAGTIAETIDSGLSQNVDKEVIVVNDGSTDASDSAIRRFGGRVRYVSTANRGVSAARTTALEMARGEFIQYLDSDDQLAAGTLAKRLSVAHTSGADVVHTQWQKLIQTKSGTFAPAEVILPDLVALAESAEICTATSRFWAPPAALLYRRGLVDRLTWHPRLPIIQDARYLFDAAVAGAHFTFLPEVGALYRVTPQSLSRSALRFTRDCSLNTQEIEDIWRSRAPLSKEQESALVSMWQHVAMSSLHLGLDHFETARQGINRNGSRSLRVEAGHMMRMVVGPIGSASFLAHARSLKAVARRLLQQKQGPYQSA